MTIYKRNRELINKSEVTRQQKLVNLYNQERGTDYTIESVGIETIKIRKGSVPQTQTNVTNRYFGYRYRTGQAFNPSKVHAEEKRKELKNLRKVWC